MRYCENCGQPAGEKRAIRDDRIDKVVQLFFCSEACAEAKMEKCHRQSFIARLAS